MKSAKFQNVSANGKSKQDFISRMELYNEIKEKKIKNLQNEVDKELKF